MNTALMITSEPTRAGKASARHGSSDCLTKLVPERENLINPVAYMKWREAVVALVMGEEIK